MLLICHVFEGFHFYIKTVALTLNINRRLKYPGSAEILDISITKDVRKDRVNEEWINVVVKRNL